MVVCVSSFPSIDDVMVYILVRNVMQRFTYITNVCYSMNSYAGILVTGNRLTNILDINYSCISAYAIIIKKKN